MIALIKRRNHRAKTLWFSVFIQKSETRLYVDADIGSTKSNNTFAAKGFDEDFNFLLYFWGSNPFC